MFHVVSSHDRSPHGRSPSGVANGLRRWDQRVVLRRAAMPTRSLATSASQARATRLDDALALSIGGLVAVAVFLAVLAAAPASAAGRKAAKAADEPAATPAQITLHRCVRADGGVSWQDHPCPADSRSVGQREYAMPQPPVSATPPARGTQRASARIPQPVRASALPRKAPDACAQARRARDQAREAAGLRADYALIERTDRAVWMACRGG